MIVYRNECVDCGLPCLGLSCPYSHVERTYCDQCGDQAETTELYGMDLCDDCARILLDE